jgi:glycosyltransferase involved in cell wall biosynthesis
VEATDMNFDRANLHAKAPQPPTRKVLFFQHSSQNGGAPRSLKQIVQSYEAECGPQTVLFVSFGPVLETYKDVRSMIKIGRRIRPFHGSEVSGMNWRLAVRNIIGLATVPWTYFRFLRDYDVIYLNSTALCFHGLFARIMGPRSTRIIYHIREPLLKNFWGQVIRLCVQNSADQIIAISKNELNNLNLPNVRGEVVYNYVNTAEYSIKGGDSLHRQDPAVETDAFVVGYFARLHETNGIADFIKVANDLKSRPNIAFVVYGLTGQERKEIESLLKKASSNVHVYPMVSDVPRNLGDIDLLLVPFNTPHFSRSVIEAAMLGIPSIIYDVSSLNETVKNGETGYIVPRGDTVSMGNRVIEIYKDFALRRKLGTAARIFARTNFSEQNYEKIKAIINAQKDEQGLN